MVDLPATCTKCHRPFTTPVVLEETGSTLNAKCPRCGGKGQLLPGQFTIFSDDRVEYQTVEQSLHGAKLSRSQFENLTALLTEACKNPQLSREEVCAALLKVPELRSLADAVPQTRQDLYSFIQAILGILAVYYARKSWLASRPAKNKQKRLRRARARKP